MLIVFQLVYRSYSIFQNKRCAKDFTNSLAGLEDTPLGNRIETINKILKKL